MNKTSTRFFILAIIAALGLIVTVALSHQFYQVRGGLGGFKSICNISQKMNCDAVAASPYAELIAETPLSAFGTAWFLATFIISLLCLGESWRKEGSRALLALFTLGSGVSVIYIYIMGAILKTFCLYCLMIDGLNFIGLGIALSLEPWKKTSQGLDFGKWKIVIGILVGSLFTSLAMTKQFDSSTPDVVSVAEVVQSIMSSPPVEVNAGDEFPSFGPKSAPITIVEFSDFQCPFCRLGALGLNTVINRYPDQVRVVFRNYPLDPICNPEVQRSMHQFACEEARTVLCAHRQGKFKETYESFFEHQAGLSAQGPNSPLEMAKAEGVSAEGLATCLNSPEISTAISKDIQEAKRLGIISTPTFFVNGRKVEGVRPPSIWNQIIDTLLKDAKK